MEGLASKAIDIQFHHIKETLEPVALTANVRLLRSVTCDACPALDILIVGGLNPIAYKLSPRLAKFIESHLAAGKTLWTTCTGAFTIGMARES
jgi:transcriptional regulator GlxA family with amidase domain